MKIASLKHGRDGHLIIVDSKLQQYALATDIAPSLQAALDDWGHVEAQLLQRSARVEDGSYDELLPFDPAQCASPLPRAYQIVDGSAYLYHVELVRKARGAEMPPEFLHDPLMYQGVSDTILGPRDPVPVGSEAYGIDFEAEVAVITTDVPMGVNEEDAGAYIALVMIMNDVSLRGLIPAELGKGFGFLQSKPPSAFSPVAVTPEGLGSYWNNGVMNLPLVSVLNGVEIGHPNAGEDVQFNFPQLIAHAAKTRPLGAGTIVGSGTVSNRVPDSGSSCMAEIRMIEKIDSGEFVTPFLKYGDTIKIDMCDEQGQTIFGSIEQTITPYEYHREMETKKTGSNGF